jgi:hypothetical protein
MSEPTKDRADDQCADDIGDDDGIDRAQGSVNT